MTDSYVEAVCADLHSRSERGVAKYGTTLERDDLSQQEWMQHLYEELLDAALYLKRLMGLSSERVDIEETIYTAYRAGRKAGIDDISGDSNPHPKGSELYDAWVSGWFDGFK